MAITYDNTLPTDKDKVRFLIQDTDTANGYLHDSEIKAILDIGNNVKESAAICCETLAARFAYKADLVEIDETKYKYENISIRFLNLANRIRSQGSTRASVYAGGVSNIDMQLYQDDSDTTKSKFNKDDFNY